MDVHFGGGERSCVAREAKLQEIGYLHLQNRRVHWYISPTINSHTQYKPIANSYTHVGVLGLGV